MVPLSKYKTAFVAVPVYLMLNPSIVILAPLEILIPPAEDWRVVDPTPVPSRVIPLVIVSSLAKVPAATTRVSPSEALAIVVYRFPPLATSVLA